MLSFELSGVLVLVALAVRVLQTLQQERVDTCFHGHYYNLDLTDVFASSEDDVRHGDFMSILVGFFKVELANYLEVGVLGATNVI